MGDLFERFGVVLLVVLVEQLLVLLVVLVLLALVDVVPDVPRYETCRVRSVGMTTYETPRDGQGRRVCEHCHGPLPKSLGTKPRRYCGRSCRQRAYEARRTREAVVTAVAVAVARARRAAPSEPSRDVPRPAAGGA